MSVRNIILWIVCVVFAFPVLAQLNTQSPELEAFFSENDLAPTSTQYGLFYEIKEDGTGQKPEIGDYLVMNYTGYLLDGSKFDESDPADPFVFQVGYRQVIRGWDLGIRFIPIGSKAVLYIPPGLAYGSRGAGSEIPPNAPLIFEVEPIKILSPEEYDRYMIELEKKEQAAFRAEMERQFVEDKRKIQEYALSNKLRTNRTDSGLSYIITKKGKGEPARVGDDLVVEYEGFLLNGVHFEKGEKRKIHEFTLGKGKVIKGWDEGLTYFSEGSEGMLLVPSKLAYGPRSIYEENASVPAHSVLIFKIKLKKITREVIEE